MEVNTSGRDLGSRLGQRDLASSSKAHSRTAHLPTIPRTPVIKDSLIDHALHILDTVNTRFGKGDAYLEQVYGPCITTDHANRTLVRYLRDEGLYSRVKIKWSTKLACSARLVFRGYARKLNKPETRKYTLMLNSTRGNFYLREKAIIALADHEIGTHYVRAHNEGLQVWYSERSKFHLSSPRSYRSLLTEEGLATLNTHLRFDCKVLWLPALLYYAACVAPRMDSDQLHHHLGKYVDNHEFRNKIVFRVKRSQGNNREGCSSEESGYGWDQCYFSGAMKILHRLNDIDFARLHCGRLALEDLERVKRIARTSVIKLPWFLSERGAANFGGQVASYEQSLRQIKRVNSYLDGEC